jgi:hypothetical protein
MDATKMAKTKHAKALPDAPPAQAGFDPDNVIFIPFTGPLDNSVPAPAPVLAEPPVDETKWKLKAALGRRRLAHQGYAQLLWDHWKSVPAAERRPEEGVKFVMDRMKKKKRSRTWIRDRVVLPVLKALAAAQ